MTEPTPRGWPEPLTIWTTETPFQAQTVVTLDATGMTWRCDDARDESSAPWELIGGLQHTTKLEKQPVTEVVSIGGQVLGTIRGTFHSGGRDVPLAGIVTSFRPDLFVEVPGNRLIGSGGCIRREVIAFEGTTGEASDGT